MRFRRFEQKDFGKEDGHCSFEGGDTILYPPEYWESHESFKKRLDQFPEGCLSCTNDKDEIVGYMFCHPWDDTFVPLDFREFKIPDKPTCLYIHDVAVIPSWRNKGIASHFLFAAKEISIKYNYKYIKAISVLDSLSYWINHGFKHVKEIPYGENHKGTIIILNLNQ